jgi:lipopolysaccharide export system protein LptC
VQIGIPVYQAGMDVRFAAAARHSRLVRILRVLVPTVVVLAMAAIVAISIFNPFRQLTKLPLDMGNLVVSGSKITMESPHLSGFSTDRRPYEMWAKTATQDMADPNHLELNMLKAKLLTEDKTTILMDARTGLYNTKSQTLDLHKDIVVRSSTGYEARLSQASVDLANNSITSEEHVEVKLLNGTLTADKLRVTERGDVARFEGHVVMNLTIDQPAEIQADEAVADTGSPPAPQATKPRSSPAKRAIAK